MGQIKLLAITHLKNRQLQWYRQEAGARQSLLMLLYSPWLTCVMEVLLQFQCQSPVPSVPNRRHPHHSLRCSGAWRTPLGLCAFWRCSGPSPPETLYTQGTACDILVLVTTAARRLCCGASARLALRQWLVGMCIVIKDEASTTAARLPQPYIHATHYYDRVGTQRFGRYGVRSTRRKLSELLGGLPEWQPRRLSVPNLPVVPVKTVSTLLRKVPY